MTLHSYGELWLIPWGDTIKPVYDYDDMLKFARIATYAIENEGGTSYVVGTPAKLINPTSGT